MSSLTMDGTSVGHRLPGLTLGVGALLLNLLVLTVPRGIGYGAALLLLSALLWLWRARPWTPLNADEWVLLAGLLAFPAVILLSMALHGDWQWDYVDRPSRFLLVIPIFLAVRYWGLSRRWLFLGMIAGAIGAGGLGFYQKYLLGRSVAEGFTHKIPFGDIALMLGMFSLAAFVPSRHWRAPRWLLGLALVGGGGGLLGSLCSGTRGGWISLPFLMWLLLAQVVPKRRTRWALYLAFLGGLVLLYHTNALVKDKVDRAAADTYGYFAEGTIAGSASTRLEMWRGAWIQFTAHPWSGVGPDQYPVEAERLKAAGVFHGPIYDHPHNELLNLLAELGVLGGLSLCLLYGLTILYFYRGFAVDRQLASMGLLLIFGYIDFSLTQAMFKHNISISFLALNLALVAGLLSHLLHRSGAPGGS